MPNLLSYECESGLGIIKAEIRNGFSFKKGRYCPLFLNTERAKIETIRYFSFITCVYVYLRT